MIYVPDRRASWTARGYMWTALAVAAAMALAGCADSASGHPAAGGNPKPQASTTPVVPPPSPHTVTERTVRRLLAQLSAPPGAAVRTTAPAKPLRNPGGLPEHYRVSRTHWWVAPGSVAAALVYFKAHPVSGTTLSGTGSTGGPGSGNLRTLDFSADGRSWSRPKLYTQLGLEVDVMKIGDHVGIRADADAIVLPQRTRAEYIPSSVTSVHVVVGRGSGKHTIERTLGAAAARRLAKVVDRLPVANPEPIPCPAQLPGYGDTLTFRGAGAPIRVRAESDGCGAVTVYRPHALQPTLSDGAAVDKAARAALRND